MQGGGAFGSRCTRGWLGMSSRKPVGKEEKEEEEEEETVEVGATMVGADLHRSSLVIVKFPRCNQQGLGQAGAGLGARLGAKLGARHGSG